MPVPPHPPKIRSGGVSGWDLEPTTAWTTTRSFRHCWPPTTSRAGARARRSIARPAGALTTLAPRPVTCVAWLGEAPLGRLDGRGSPLASTRRGRRAPHADRRRRGRPRRRRHGIPAGGASALESHHHEHESSSSSTGALRRCSARRSPRSASATPCSSPRRSRTGSPRSATSRSGSSAPPSSTGAADEGEPAPGIAHELRFVVLVTKTVPHLYPESPGSRRCRRCSPRGFMVGLVEWACIDAIAPHLDDGEMSSASTSTSATTRPPRPGSRWRCAYAWRRWTAAGSPSRRRPTDGRDRICAGRHVRFIVDRARFEAGGAAAGG